MGYTHYWNPSLVPVFDKEILACLTKVIQDFGSIICFEKEQEDRKPYLTEEGIRFNGRKEEAHETFGVMADESGFHFCKTARKPYDLPVCICLLLLNSYCPGFKLSSDGDIRGSDPSENWGKAREYISKNFRERLTEIARSRSKS